MIRAHGLPCTLYTDRASHYFVTSKGGEKVTKDQLTQVGRALAQLGIEDIPAYPDGTLAVFHGPRCLGRYRADSRPLDHDQPLAA